MMENKVLLAYIGLDGLFLVMGAIMMGFSVVVQNTMFDTPTAGSEAARNLLYQRFPLTGSSISRRRQGRREGLRDGGEG